MNQIFICNQARLYTSGKCYGDECLYKIGKEVGLITEADLSQVNNGFLSSSLKSRVLTWLRHNANEIGLTKQLS